MQYVHDGNDTLRDHFTIVARTDTKTSVPAVVNVKVIAVNDETPELVNNTGIEVYAGAVAPILSEHLGEAAGLI